jgi:adenosylmethionine---8-amino-7-oxononanoate aminotransferase
MIALMNPQDLDKLHCWHPFTQHTSWCAPDHEPLVLVGGRGALLYDCEGREYIDGNSSIWTNLHGHRHPRLDAALRAQLDRVAHTSFLGYTNPPAARLAAELCDLWPDRTLTRCFFSDDGSTAIEVSLKMAAQFWQQTGRPEKCRFVAFTNAYHGDTMGASSLGGIALFHGRFSEWQFPAIFVNSVNDLAPLNPDEIAAIVIEPLIQGAAGMRLWPRGMLMRLREWCIANDVLLILDEVMTGFGRTGKMFACEHENVVPDFIALAKGLTGGYVPLAATLTTERIFNAFLGGADRALYYGHSYTGNQLGCAVALANLEVFREESVLAHLQVQIATLTKLVGELSQHRHVAEVRQCGFIAGIEVRRNKTEPFPAADFTGAKICHAARRHGLLTRPIRDTIVLMPPYCITDEQLGRAVRALREAIDEVCG